MNHGTGPLTGITAVSPEQAVVKFGYWRSTHPPGRQLRVSE